MDTEHAIKITRVQVDELDPGPFPVPFQDATMGPFTHWKIHWLRLTSDDGRVGQAMGAVSADVAATLLAEGPREPERWWERLFWMHRNAGHRNPATSSTLAAVDLALHDILAQQAQLPLHRFMGAQRDSVPVYGSGGSTHLTVDELVSEMLDLVHAGFTTLKMKIGSRFGTDGPADVARVRAVREAIGPNIALAIDANQCWTASAALAFAQLVEPFNIAWFEEPVHSADRKAIARVARHCPFDIAMGESENHPLGFRDLAECGVQHLQPPPHGLPGLGAWQQAVAFARDHGRRWSSGGSSHLTALFVASEPDGLVEFLRPVVGFWAERCWAEKPTIRDGRIHLPSTPGLPITVAWDRLAARGAIRNVLDKSHP